MTQEQIEYQLAQGWSSPKKLCRLYLLACGSRLPEPFLTTLRHRLCERMQIDEKQFYDFFEAACARWQLRSEHIELEAASFPGILPVSRKFKSKGGISLSKARQLQASLCALCLQRLSIQSGKNQLKSRQLKRLFFLLSSPDQLGPFQPVFLHPFYRALKGRWKVTGKKFLMMTMMHTQLAADFLQEDACKLHPGTLSGPQHVICEFIRASKKMTPEEIEAFLAPGSSVSLHESWKIPRSGPLKDELEQTIEEI